MRRLLYIMVVLSSGVCTSGCTGKDEGLYTYGGRRLWPFTYSCYVEDKDFIKVYLMCKRKRRHPDNHLASCEIFDILVVYVPKNAASDAEHRLGYRIVKKAYYIGYISEPYSAWLLSNFVAGRVDIVKDRRGSQTYNLNLMFHCIGIDERNSQQEAKSWDIDFVGRVTAEERKNDSRRIRGHISKFRQQLRELVNETKAHGIWAEKIEHLIPELP